MRCRPAVVSSAVFGLFCVATLAVWHRSYGAEDSARFVWQGRAWELRASRGRLYLHNGPQQQLEMAQVELRQTRIVRLNAELARTGPGLFVRPRPAVMARYEPARQQILAAIARWRTVKIPRTAAHSTSVPLWVLLALLALPPLAQGMLLIRRLDRRRRNCCPACAYDLRATPGRCPECGTPADAPLLDPWAASAADAIQQVTGRIDARLRRYDRELRLGPGASAASWACLILGWVLLSMFPLAAYRTGESWIHHAVAAPPWEHFLLLAIACCGAGVLLIRAACRPGGAEQRVRGE